MKKLYTWLLMVGLPWAIVAQNITPYSISHIGGYQKPVPTDVPTKSDVFYFNGNPLAAGKFKPIVGVGTALCGMPYGVSFFPRVLEKEVTISKGYFPDYVFLEWNVIASANRIKRIKIYRKPLGDIGDSILVANLPGDQTSYRDEFAEKGTIYKYTVYLEGIADGILAPFVNVTEGIGFSFPFGTASGRVTFSGGTAVEGVTIAAETDGNLRGRCLTFNGINQYAYIEHKAEDTELELNQGFTFQAWLKKSDKASGTIFAKGPDYQLSYSTAGISFRVKDKTLLLPYTANADTFFHVSVVYKVDSLLLYVQVNDKLSYVTKVAAGQQPEASESAIYIGSNASEADYFKGSIDEVRLYNIALSKATIKTYFDKYIGGNEAGMAGYWKLNEGFGNQFFDFSRRGSTFNNNNATIFNKATWTDLTPLNSQLSYKGITDANGNYVVNGFPYANAGSQYIFTPMLGVHKFDPNQAVRYIGDGAAIQNSINFTDVSSFKVTGTVRYENSAFPVEGVSILIDGRSAITADGSLILSDNLGRFSVDVPIGEHTFQLSKNLHTFQGEGKFPLPKVAGRSSVFNYTEPIAGLEFIDVSRVKLVGRVVGGPIQAAKKLGFGKSKNNIGNAVIRITSQKGYDLAVANRTETYAGRNFGSSMNFATKFVTIMPDPISGEYIAMLPPEKYLVTGVTAGDYTFDDDAKVTLDLQTYIQTNEVVADTLAKVIRNVTVPGFPPYNPAKYREIVTKRFRDTTVTFGLDTFYFDSRKDFILRNRPQISVLNKDGSELFGDKSFTYTDKALNINQEIGLINTTTGEYLLGFPVFGLRKPYQMKIKLFESYTNASTSVTEQVPVVDGRIEIINNLATSTDVETLALNDKGEATYKFSGGLPNIAVNNLNPELSFTKTLNIVAVSGQGGNLRTVWRESNPFRGIVFGAMPTGNNFVTTGPKDLIAVLRDPPGSNSSTTLEKGTVIASQSSWDVTNSITQDATMKFEYGITTKVFAGVGAGTITETEATSNLTIGISSEQNWTSSDETETVTTTTETWSTSGEPNFVGRDADLYIGCGTNLVYGRADIVQLIPKGQCKVCVGDSTTGYRLGITSGIRMTPEFSTAFMFTQHHIEKTLIPDLIRLRDLNLKFIDPNTVDRNTITEPVYVSKIPPSDPKFGTDNRDKEVWGNLAITDNIKLGNGPSYQVIMPTNWPANKQYPDTVFFYNRSIKEWITILSNNESEKVKAKFEKNISFDAGTNYSSSTTVDTTKTNTSTFDFFVSPSVVYESGASIMGFGAGYTLAASYKHADARTTSDSKTESVTYSYTIADASAAQADDGVANEYMSVDVKKPSDGFGPVFSVRGGATSCPYQGDEKTKYFEPGRHTLNAATLQIEKPDLTVRQAVVKDVPANRSAEFVIDLYNNSESNENLEYSLKVGDEANPYGALIEMDGSAIGNGRTIMVPAGSSIQKVIKVSKGLSSQMDYENLEIKFESDCDPNISVSKFISAYFLPGCSDVTMDMPKQKWVLNTNIVPKDTLMTKIINYDLNFRDFKSISFQYKPSSSSTWITDKVFYNPNSVDQATYLAATGNKGWIEDGTINHPFDMRSLPDRNYDIRAKTTCEVGPGVKYETPTDIISGLKDVKRPRVFGSPQPADGILSNGDEISIKFDETIEAGLLTPFNFSLKGILNSVEIDHYTSLNFDGLNDYVSVRDGLDLSGKSFTVEFWLRRNEQGRKQVVFSKGTSEEDAIEFGFDAANKLYVKFGTQTFTSSSTFTSALWNHYAFTFDNATKRISAYMNDMTALENLKVTQPFNGLGAINFGKSIYNSSNYLNGNLHDARIWNEVKSKGTIYANMYASLSGSEINLASYWPMNEADGNKAIDKASARHALLFADWLVEPRGKSYHFNGLSSYVKLNTASSVVISNQMDYTIEFWFKAPQQTNAVMFSSGKADGTDIFNKKENSVAIGLDENGKLYVSNNGFMLLQSNELAYTDNNWHHFAFSLNRNANAVMVVDGIEVSAVPSTNFGGLSGVEMFAGARGFKTNSTTINYDKFFEGKIDELRIWKMAKKINHILLDKNAKLTGSEIGLVAYYPFENYITSLGIKISEPTISDKWINPFGSNAGNLVVSGTNPDYSDDVPNIKDARPLKNIDFDWVVNNDEIIITPSKAMVADIEKTTLEISVQNVEDKNENRLSSPESWTAFVDRNQLRWGEVKIEKSKKLYDAMTFTIDIINNGGTEQNYKIENIPTWLTLSPASGTLAPKSTRKITFNVYEGQNVGYFSQTLYLGGNFKYKEKLDFDLRVYDQEPTWSVDKSKFQYSMNVIGTLKINGVLSTDSYDKIGVFVNGECRGVAKPVYFESLDKYFVFLDIYSNKEFGDSLTFQIYQAKKGVVFDDVQPKLIFETNALEGNIALPVVFTSDDNFQRSLPLAVGWNWVSINLNSPNNTKISRFFRSIKPQKGDLIKSKTFFDQYNEGLGWLGSLSNNGGLKSGEMYMIKMQNQYDFVYKGSKIRTSLVPITISKGWNWLGYVPDLNYTVKEAFVSFNPMSGDIVKSQSAFSVYDTRLGWVGTLQYLTQGKGYLYKSGKTGVFTFPEEGLNARLEKQSTSIEPYSITPYWKPNYRLYQSNMSMVISVVGVASNEAATLGAFVGNKVVGATYLDSENLYFLTINAENDTDTISFKYENGKGKVIESTQTASYRKDEVLGSIQNPYLLRLDKSSSDSELPFEVRVAPNPIKKGQNLEISITGAQAEECIINITNLLGSVIQSEKFVLNNDTILLNTTQLNHGVYFLKVNDGLNSKVVKIIVD
jgi:hypothetical protein